jgi:hypothetical protein
MSISMPSGLSNQLNLTNNKTTQIAFRDYNTEDEACLESYNDTKNHIQEYIQGINDSIASYKKYKSSNPPFSKMSKQYALNAIDILFRLIKSLLIVCGDSLNPGLDLDKIRELEEKLKELEGLKGQLNAISVQKNSTASVIKPIKKPAPQQSWQDQMWHNLQKIKLPPILPRSLPPIPSLPPLPVWPFPNMPNF